MLRAVMDTNVLDSAFRSRLGYSFEVFVALRRGQWRAVVSNHLAPARRIGIAVLPPREFAVMLPAS